MHPNAEKIQAKFPDSFVSEKEWRGDLAVTVKKDAIVPICRYLHDDPGMGFDYIVHVSSVDYPEDLRSDAGAQVRDRDGLLRHVREHL